MKTLCEVHHLGIVDYQQAWQIQNDMADEIGRGLRLPSLLLLEHPHCYTFGRQGNPGNLLWDEATLRAEGVSLHWVDRGGDVTYHGPGQLVGYPLVHLEPPGVKPAPIKDDMSQEVRIPRADYVGYMRKLELVIIQAVRRLGLKTTQMPGLTGVWVQDESGADSNRLNPSLQPGIAKLAALGIKVDARGVTRHGFALNINTDRHYWDGIIACGLSEHRIATLSDFIQPAPSIQEVENLISSEFGKILNYEMIDL